MADASHYVIRGGLEGRERLRVLSRVMHATTTALFDRLSLRDGLQCLDAGCGGGDATLELARRVAPRGTVIGIDMDETKLELARAEAKQMGISNVEFRAVDIRAGSGVPVVDVVYSRFLLTHLSDPAGAVAAFRSCLRPGGMIGIEDVDFSGYLTYPESPAFRRYHELYCATVAKRGGDPNIGPRVPLLLRHSGFVDISVAVVQPVALQGEPKLLKPRCRSSVGRRPCFACNCRTCRRTGSVPPRVRTHGVRLTSLAT